MDPEELFEASLETTEIIKKREYNLYTFGVTNLPYFFISRSEIDTGDTVTRKGKIVVEKPRLYLPNDNPVFEGFEFDDDVPVNEDDIKYLLLSRRIRLPSLRYINREDRISVEEINVDEKINSIQNRLENKSDTVTGIIRGEDRLFPFPLFIYVGLMIQRSADDNIIDLLERKGDAGL